MASSGGTVPRGLDEMACKPESDAHGFAIRPIWNVDARGPLRSALGCCFAFPTDDVFALTEGGLLRPNASKQGGGSRAGRLIDKLASAGIVGLMLAVIAIRINLAEMRGGR
jgi:hypothetical protein